MTNPFLAPIPAQGTSALSIARRQLEPFVAEHMEGFAGAVEGRNPKDPTQRVRAHQLLRVAWASAEQARHVAMESYKRANPLALGGVNGRFQQAFEAPLGSSTLRADITDFITQMIHMSLDVFPRLISTRLVSVQPFTQPSGYVFYLNRVATDDSDRDLSDLDNFDSSYGDRAAEGDQVKAVGTTLTKTLVEVTWHALMRQHSHEVDVAMRSQYGLDVGQLGDIAAADELAWEIDRQVVDAVVTFAGTNTAGTVYFDDTAGGSYSGYTPSEQAAYDKEILSKTLTGVEIDMAGTIFRRPNWYICGLNFAKVLARTPEFLAEDMRTEMFDQVMAKGSIISSGRMQSGAQIWLDPQLDTDTCIAGYVDNMNPFYAGYIFCPFGMSSILTAAFMDPDTLLEKRSRALAYAKVGVRADQFREIKLGTAS